MTSFPAKALAALLLAGLAGCGSGEYHPAETTPPVTPEPPVTPPVTPEPPVTPPVTPPAEPEPPVKPPPASALDVYSVCQYPKPASPATGKYFPDKQGTLNDELDFVRLWIDETYLWYEEVPGNLNQSAYKTTVDYFNDLKTPLLTQSGQPKDRFHFTYTAEHWEELSKGVELGYGLTWARSTEMGQRMWQVAAVEAGSAAALAGLQRGDQLLRVDGDDFVNGAGTELVARLNAGLFPVKAGEQHRLVVTRAGVEREVALVSAKISVAPVQSVKVIDTAAGKVGYLIFNEHNGVAEKPLVQAIQTFKDAGVSDLVLDMRYNGGGQVLIAAELAYMIAGPAQTANKTFELSVGNDKVDKRQPTPFRAKAVGYAAPDPVKAGTELPSLGLKRVTLLTGPGTCSASESLINGLRGADVTVNLIGGQTCGKPYAFVPASNCGTTYFAIQFQSVNAKGFGDYADGFAPTCRVPDDFGHELGDRAEGQLAAALQYRSSGSCPAVAQGTRARSGGAAPSAVPAPVLVPVRPMGKEISIIGL